MEAKLACLASLAAVPLPSPEAAPVTRATTLLTALN